MEKIPANITAKFYHEKSCQNAHLSKLFDKLLVLVKLLQVFGVHARNTIVVGFITMLLIAQNADLHFWTRNVLQPKILQ